MHHNYHIVRFILKFLCLERGKNNNLKLINKIKQAHRKKKLHLIELNFESQLMLIWMI